MEENALTQALLNAVKPNRNAPERADPIAKLKTAIEMLERQDVRKLVDGGDPISFDAHLYTLKRMHDGLRGVLNAYLNPARTEAIEKLVKTRIAEELGDRVEQVFVNTKAVLTIPDGDLLVAVKLSPGEDVARTLADIGKGIEAVLVAGGELCRVHMFDLDRVKRDRDTEREKRPSMIRVSEPEQDDTPSPNI